MPFQLTGTQQPGLSTPANYTPYTPPVAPPAPPTTGYNVQVPDVIPSPVYDSGTSVEDVFQKRNQYQGQVDTKMGNQTILQNMYSQLLSGDMSGLMARPQTNAATMRDQLLNDIAAQTQGFADNYGNTITNAYQNAGVQQANDQLSAIQEQAGDRQVRQRQDVRGIQSSADARGYTQSGIDDNVNSVNVIANQELADLAIQELAATGRYDRALEIANAEIDQNATAFDQTIAAYQAQLDALQPTLDNEDQLFANTLKFQIGQLEAQAQKQRDDQKTVVSTAMEAASQGAPQSLVQQIANAGSPEEAAALAAPYIGLQDRLNSEASRANIWSQIRERNAKNAPANSEQNRVERARDTERNLKNVVDAIANTKGFSLTGGKFNTPQLGTAGFGSFLGKIPIVRGGTEQLGLASTIDTIKANLGFDELDAMRKSSPTGGALGQVSEKEIEFLQATISNLNTEQRPEQLKANLQEVFNYFELWANDNGYVVAPDGTLIEIID